MRSTLKVTGRLSSAPMPTAVRDELARRLSAMRKEAIAEAPFAGGSGTPTTAKPGT